MTAAWRGEAPFLKALPVTHHKLGSGVRSFVTGIKQTGWRLSESHVRDALGSVQGGGEALCCVWVIVSLSPSTFGRQQQADKQIERLFDAGVLFLCETPTPILLHCLGGNTTGRDAWSDCEV